MAISLLELNQLSEDLVKTDPFRNWRERDDQLHFRSLYVKHDYQLAALVPMYERKIKRVIEHYDQMRRGFLQVPKDELEEALGMVEAKIRRLSLKLRDTNLEIQGRELDNLKRNPIGTEYFIDLDGGNNGNDGLTTGNAWLTIEQYTTTTVRSPGDIAWVRAATDEVVGAANIEADEDGTAAGGLIYIIGCDDGDNDKWSDGVATRPIIDFNAGAYGMAWDSDELWSFRHLEVKNSAYSAWNGSQWTNSNGFYTEFIDCKSHRAQHASDAYGLRLVGTTYALVEDCAFEDNRHIGIRMDPGCSAVIRRTTFDGGAGFGQDVGIHIRGSRARLEECQFGQTTAHDTRDFDCDTGGRLWLIKCTSRDVDASIISSTGCARLSQHTWSTGSRTANTAFYTGCEVSYQTSVVRSGGSDYALQIIPRTTPITPSPMHPCGLAGGFLNEDADWPLRLYLTAAEHTITVYVRADAAYSTYPTADQLYLEATYEGADPYDLTVAKSDEVLSDGSTWVGLQVTITPGRAGMVYLDVKYGYYEAGRSIYVDPAPVVT